MKLLATLVALAASLSLASAQSVYSVVLDGAQEAPPNASPGTGNGSVTSYMNNMADPNDDTIDYTFTFGGLTAGVTRAHIHGPAGAGVAAGVLFNLNPAGVLLNTSGTFGEAGVLISAATSQAIKDGLAYVNIHTEGQFHNPGEIRGQLIIPEPASAVLFGLGALALLRRRK